MSDHRQVVVTMDLVKFGATGGVGFSKRQIRLLEKGRPRRGWISRSLGKRISYADALEFLTTARRQEYRPRPDSPEYREIIAILDRLAAEAGSDASCGAQAPAAAAGTADIERIAAQRAVRDRSGISRWAKMRARRRDGLRVITLEVRPSDFVAAGFLESGQESDPAAVAEAARRAISAAMRNPWVSPAGVAPF